MVNSGVYRIRSLFDGNVYVGSAINFIVRFNLHKHLLKNNRHKNTYLQNAWNKYGESNFVFEIVEYIEDIDFLVAREQCWTYHYSKDKKYNIRRVAWSNLGYKHTKETKKKISEKQKDIPKLACHKKKIGLGNKGKIRTIAFKKNLCILMQGKKQTPELIQRRVESRKLFYKQKKFRKEMYLYCSSF